MNEMNDESGTLLKKSNYVCMKIPTRKINITNYGIFNLKLKHPGLKANNKVKRQNKFWILAEGWKWYQLRVQKDESDTNCGCRRLKVIPIAGAEGWKWYQLQVIVIPIVFGAQKFESDTNCGDRDTNCNWCAWNEPQRFGKQMEEPETRRRIETNNTIE